jgi:hypothetical protein
MAPYVARKPQRLFRERVAETDHFVRDEEYPHLADGESSYSILIPVVPLECNFASQRLMAGLRALTGSFLGIGVGIYLATEATTAHPLQMKVAFVAAVYCLLGLALVPLTIRELFGRLSVDSFGIRVSAGLFGFAIPWDELDRWSIDGSSFRFHSMKTGVTEFVRIDHLSADDCKSLVETLKSCAPEREQKISLRTQWSR